MKVLAVSALLSAIMALTAAAAGNPDVEDDNLDLFKFPWVQIGRRFFYYVSRPLTWAEAEMNCRSLGGHLASVESSHEYDFMRRLIRGSNSDPIVWLGGSNEFKKKVWKWTDGTPFNFTKWCPGEPNNKRHGNCLQMNYSKRKCWNDISCGYRLPSYCIKKKN